MEATLTTQPSSPTIEKRWTNALFALAAPRC